MGRSPRTTVPGFVYHLLNRRVMRLTLFQKEGDYEAFEAILLESLAREDSPRLLAYCLMPNHWHLVVQATARTDLSTWMQWVAVTHTHRYHTHYHTVGEGPLYQGRFKSFPIQDDHHFLTVCRYVEANAFRAKLVADALSWRWSSLHARWSSNPSPSPLLQHLANWPVDRPPNWVIQVNRDMPKPALERVRRSVARGSPLGEDAWTARIASKLGLESTLRSRGRPRRDETEKLKIILTPFLLRNYMN